MNAHTRPSPPCTGEQMPYHAAPDFAPGKEQKTIKLKNNTLQGWPGTSSLFPARVRGVALVKQCFQRTATCISPQASGTARPVR